MRHLAKRRNDLQKVIGSSVALFANGLPRYRNILASTYPFRGSSHFLHFFGHCPPGARAAVTDKVSIIFLQPETPDHEIWHGKSESKEEILEKTGVDEVLLVSDLPEFLKSNEKKNYFAIPSLDPVTNVGLRALLGRPPALNGPDGMLAEAISRSRSTHDEFAIEEIRKAAEITEEAFQIGMKISKPGIREALIKAEMESFVSRKGFDQAFRSIVSTNGEVLHNEKSTNTTKEGDLLLVDFGAESPEGYASDVTRTWPVSGKFTARQKDIYDLVLSAQKHGISHVRAGVSFADIHLAVCYILVQGLVDLGLLEGNIETLVDLEVHRAFFPHGLGHLLGLDVHDMEDLGSIAQNDGTSDFDIQNLRLNRKLEQDMVVTIEPGIYFIPALLDEPEQSKNFEKFLKRETIEEFRKEVRGIRIEDMLLVQEEGVENLSGNIPKEISDLEDTLGGAIQ